MNIISGVHKQIFGLMNDEVEWLRMFTSYSALLGLWNVGGSEGLGMCCNERDSV